MVCFSHVGRQGVGGGPDGLELGVWGVRCEGNVGVAEIDVELRADRRMELARKL
jgi:hypothetical protein